MSNLASTAGLGVLPPVPTPITGRNLSYLPADTAAIRAMAQAAINVELFTIPLYMAAMTSLQGTHEINASGISYYEGRAWPGLNTAANPASPNQKAYNAIFAVFIEEMLHLQLAANISTSMGFTPSFTSAALQNADQGWTCYGPTLTTIPHIINLTDMVAPYNGLVVNLGAVTTAQIQLFQVIEQDHATALANIQPGALSKYFPVAPFAGWTPQMTEQNLPLFGTIGWMYYCYMQYLTMVYTDGQTLYQKLFQSGSVQQDMFNWAGGSGSSHPMPEYPGMSATVTATSPLLALAQVVDMILGITDQGEGAGSQGSGLRHLLPAAARAAMKIQPPLEIGNVDPVFQPSYTALQADYPSYNSDGSQAANSADATARSNWGGQSHYAAFTAVQGMIDAGGIVTFPTWFAGGNNWTAALLTSQPPNPSPPSNIPSPQQVADALNALSGEAALLNTVVTGSIAGVTSGLNGFWQKQNATFPYPAMVGAGDRMTLCWAAGSSPDISGGLTPVPSPGRAPSACQGLNYEQPTSIRGCATVSVFHSCRGTNACTGQGGCGFAQPISGGGGQCGTTQCGTVTAAKRSRKPRMTATATNLCGGPTPPTPSALYSAPGDNKCSQLGGCAVPISASQLFPEAGNMQVYNLFSGTPQPIGTIPFNVGDAVYDIAWNAYIAALQNQGVSPLPGKPVPSTLRLALPPST